MRTSNESNGFLFYVVLFFVFPLAPFLYLLFRKIGQALKRRAIRLDSDDSEIASYWESVGQHLFKDNPFISDPACEAQTAEDAGGDSSQSDDNSTPDSFSDVGKNDDSMYDSPESDTEEYQQDNSDDSMDEDDWEEFRRSFFSEFGQDDDHGSAGYEKSGTGGNGQSTSYCETHEADSTITMHLATLGLKDGFSTAELKAAFRLMLKSHHPDLATDPEAKAQAERKTREVIEAFRYLGSHIRVG